MTYPDNQSDQPEEELLQRGLAQDLVTHALEGGAATLGALGAKDAYDKVKEKIHKEESKIILPPGTKSDE
jgi:hypothetical protein